VQPVADIRDGPPGHGPLQTLGQMFAVFRAVTTLQCIAQKLLQKTEITHHLHIYSQITAEKWKFFASQGASSIVGEL